MQSDYNGSKNYIFITANIDWEPYTSGLKIAETLAGSKVWLVSKYTPYQKFYKKGDRILLYVSGKTARCFVGDAVLTGGVSEATASDKDLAEELGLEGFDKRLRLDSVRIWKEYVPVKSLIDKLIFIKDKKNYGLHFRQAATRIPDYDFDIIMSEVDG